MRRKPRSAPRKKHTSTYHRRAVRREDELTKVRQLYALPRDEKGKREVERYLREHAHLLSFLVACGEALYSAYDVRHAYTELSLEIVCGTLTVIMRTETSTREGLAALDAFERDALARFVEDIDRVRFDVDLI